MQEIPRNRWAFQLFTANNFMWICTPPFSTLSLNMPLKISKFREIFVVFWLWRAITIRAIWHTWNKKFFSADVLEIKATHHTTRFCLVRFLSMKKRCGGARRANEINSSQIFLYQYNRREEKTENFWFMHAQAHREAFTETGARSNSINKFCFFKYKQTLKIRLGNRSYMVFKANRSERCTVPAVYRIVGERTCTALPRNAEKSVDAVSLSFSSVQLLIFRAIVFVEFV